MAIFEEVVLVWDGGDGKKEFKLPPESRLRAIAAIEDVLTMGDLATASAKRSFPLAKMSIAYGRLLRFCGANISDEQVYAGLFRNAPDMASRVLNTLYTLQMLMIPPESLRAVEKKEGAAAEKQTAGASLPATGSSAGAEQLH